MALVVMPAEPLLSPKSSSSSRQSSERGVGAPFDLNAFLPFLRQLLPQRLAGVAWDQSRAKELGESLAREIKTKMLEMTPPSWKLLVICQISEQRGQGSSSYMTCQWDAAADVCLREVFENVRCFLPTRDGNDCEATHRAL